MSVVTDCTMKNSWIGEGEETPVLPSSFFFFCFYSVPERLTGPVPDTLFSLKAGWGRAEFFSPCLCTGELQATRCNSLFQQTEETLKNILQIFNVIQYLEHKTHSSNLRMKYRHWWSVVKYFGFVFGLQTEAIRSLRKRFLFPVLTWFRGERVHEPLSHCWNNWKGAESRNI